MCVCVCVCVLNIYWQKSKEKVLGSPLSPHWGKAGCNGPSDLHFCSTLLPGGTWRFSADWSALTEGVVSPSGWVVGKELEIKLYSQTGWNAHLTPHCWFLGELPFKLPPAIAPFSNNLHLRWQSIRICFQKLLLCLELCSYPSSSLSTSLKGIMSYSYCYHNITLTQYDEVDR